MKRMYSDIRKQVFERDNYTCRYCGSKQTPLHADHVYPWSKGGEISMDNLVTACERCNKKKHDKVGMYPNPLPEPFLENKNELYRFAGLFAIVIGVAILMTPFTPIMVKSYGITMDTVKNYVMSCFVLCSIGMVFIWKGIRK